MLNINISLHQIELKKLYSRSSLYFQLGWLFSVHVESLWDSDGHTNVTSSIVTIHSYIPSYPPPLPLFSPAFFSWNIYKARWWKFGAFFLTNLLFLPQGGGGLFSLLSVHKREREGGGWLCSQREYMRWVPRFLKKILSSTDKLESAELQGVMCGGRVYSTFLLSQLFVPQQVRVQMFDDDISLYSPLSFCPLQQLLKGFPCLAHLPSKIKKICFLNESKLS